MIRDRFVKRALYDQREEIAHLIATVPTADAGLALGPARARGVEVADGKGAVVREPRTLGGVVLAQLKALVGVADVGDRADELAGAGAGHEAFLELYVRIYKNLQKHSTSYPGFKLPERLSKQRAGENTTSVRLSPCLRIKRVEPSPLRPESRPR